MKKNIESICSEMKKFFIEYYENNEDLIGLDDFLLVFILKVLNDNLVNDYVNADKIPMLEDFASYYKEQATMFDDYSSEYSLFVIKDWLKELDFSAKRDYVYSLDLFDDITDDGKLQLRSSHFSTEQVLEDFENKILQQIEDKNQTTFYTNEFLLLLAKVVVSYLDYTELLSKDVILSSFFNTFKDKLFHENWEEQMQNLLLKMDVSDIKKRDLLPKNVYKNLIVDFSGFKIKVYLNKKTEDESIKMVELEIGEDSTILHDEYEIDVENYVLESFQNQIIKRLGNKKSAFLSPYIDVVVDLAEIIKPYIQMYKWENSVAFSGFYMYLKDCFCFDNWREELRFRFDSLAEMEKNELLPHCHFLKKFKSFHSYFTGEGRIYVLLKDNVDYISDEIDKTKKKHKKTEIDTTINDSSINLINQDNIVFKDIVLNFEKAVINSICDKDKEVSFVYLNDLLLCIGEAIIPFLDKNREYIGNNIFLQKYYNEFGDCLKSDDWKSLIISRSSNLSEKQKFSFITLSQECKCIYFYPLIKDPLSIRVLEHMLPKLFGNEEIPVFIKNELTSTIVKNEREVLVHDYIEDSSDEGYLKPEISKPEIFLYKDRNIINEANYTRSDKELQDFWNELFKEGDPIPPFWRHKMNKKSYDRLNILLKECIKENKLKAIKNHSLKLAFLISEWYKREYNGNDSQILKDLNLRNSDSKSIWEMADIGEPLTADSNTRWLSSLYVLGGLPLEFCKTDYKTIVQKLHELKSLGATLWESEDLTLNSIVNESLSNPKGSLHLFANEILLGNYPFSVDDVSLPSVIEFKGSIDGGDDSLNNAFEVVRTYYKSKDGGLYREYHVKLCNLLRKRYISYEQLKEYIDKSVPYFQICFGFRCGNKIIESEKYKLTFNNDYCGHFVGYGTTCEVIIDDVPLDEVKDFVIKTKTLSYHPNNKQWEKSVSFGDFTQLYEKEKGTDIWIDKPTTNRTAVIYNSDIYETIERSESIVLTDGFKESESHNWFWKIIDDEVTLKNKKGGKNKSFFYRKNDYILDIEPLESEIDYINHNEVKVVISGQENNLPLLLGKKSLKIFVVNNNEKEETNDYTLDYRLKDEERYKTWTSDVILEQGIVYIRCGNVIKMVYFLPDCDDVVKRDCEFQSIVWNDRIKILGNNKYYYNDVPEYLNEAKNITEVFKLGTEDCYAIVPVFKPYNGLFLFKNNIRIGTYKESERIDIPFILQEQYSMVCYVKGEKPYLKEIGCCPHAYYLLSDDKQELILCQKFYHSSFKNVVLYKGRDKSIKEIEKEVNGSSKEQVYEFYYWSKKINDAPIKISSYNSEGLFKINMKYNNGGIVFQSLKNDTPCHYYKSIDCENEETNDIDYDFLLKCFDYACSHKIYFGVFDKFSCLLKKHSSLPSFVFNLYSRDNGILNYRDLCRLANEFKFLWAFLKRFSWIECKTRDDKAFGACVIKLFRVEACLSHNNDDGINMLFPEDYFSRDFIVEKSNLAWRYEIDNPVSFNEKAICYMRKFKNEEKKVKIRNNSRQKNTSMSTLILSNLVDDGSSFIKESTEKNKNKDNRNFLSDFYNENKPYSGLYSFMTDLGIIRK